MTKEKVLRTFFFILLFAFLVLLFAEANGYYETKTTKAKVLTEEQIKEFEKDIQSGKSVDITEYVIDSKMNYSSDLSNNIYKISLKLEKTIDTTIKYIFKKANDAIEE